MKIQSFNHCAYLLAALLWSFSATANPIHSFTLDPVQEAKLLAFDGVADDYFGGAVDISGDWAVVGASYHDGVDNNEGAVYVYRYDGVNWIFDQKLTADDAVDSDRFGQAVSVDGDRLCHRHFFVVVRRVPNPNQNPINPIAPFKGNAFVRAVRHPRHLFELGVASKKFGVGL